MLQNNGEGRSGGERLIPAGAASGCWLAVVRRKNTSPATFNSDLPPKTTGAARGDSVNVTRRLAAFAPRVPHVGPPCDA